MTTLQVAVGVLLPICLTLRREAGAAVEFARRNGIPRHDLRYRASRWTRRATTCPPCNV